MNCYLDYDLEHAQQKKRPRHSRNTKKLQSRNFHCLRQVIKIRLYLTYEIFLLKQLIEINFEGICVILG